MDILKKLTHLEKIAADFGFKWETPQQILAQIRSETNEIEADLQNPKKLQEEIGDLLHAVFSLCVFCGFEPVKTLEQSVAKFEDRFNKVKKLAQAGGFKNLQGMEFDELMRIWDKAKKS